MKEILFIEDTPANKISYYLLLVFVVMLPFDRLFSELALIGLLLHTLIHVRKGDLNWSFRWVGWMSAALYLLTMAGTLYAAKPSAAMHEWEKQLALILFPLIVWFSRLDWQWYRPRLLKGFALSCMLTAVYLYGCALHRLHEEHLPLGALFTKPFMNHAFTFPIDLHATYYSAYLALSVVVFAGLLFRGQGGKLARVGYSLAILICLAAILQLASRSVCIAVLVIMNVPVPFYLAPKMRWRVSAVVFVLSVAAFLVVSQHNQLHSRYLLSLKQDLRSDTGAVEDPEPRMARWQCAWEQIRLSPWIGYGSGAEVGKLKERYYVHHLTISYDNNLNAHNQFISFWLKTGVFGMLIYITMLVLAFREAWRRRDVYLMSFVVIIVCISMSENILDVNKGIFFFSMFFVIFLPKPVARTIFKHGNKDTSPSVGARVPGYYDLLP